MSNDLAALVGSRICHDLISPIGAISNGVELLALTDGDSSAEMALINESVENANARIRFFRIAYGATGDEQSIGRSEVLSILAAVARGGRFTYFWQVEGDQPRSEVRAAFLALQCLEASMPMGGDIMVSLSSGIWKLTATADRLRVDSDVWSTVTSPKLEDRHSAAQVQYALLPAVIKEVDRRVSVDFGDNFISVSF